MPCPAGTYIQRRHCSLCPYSTFHEEGHLKKERGGCGHKWQSQVMSCRRGKAPLQRGANIADELIVPGGARNYGERRGWHVYAVQYCAAMLRVTSADRTVLT